MLLIEWMLSTCRWSASRGSKNSNPPNIMKPTRTSFVVASSVILMASMPIAGAVATMRISDNQSNSFLIVDNAAGDLSPVAGVVVFTGTFGNWLITTDTGVTKPVSGNSVRPYMDVNFIATSSTPGGTLVIEFSEDGFGPMAPGTNYALSIGGTTQGSLNCTTLVDVNNVLFGGVELVPGGKTFTGGGFACNLGAPGTYTSPYSVTKRITITHGSGVLTSSGDTQLTVPDGGTTIAMFGLSLLGLGALRKKQRK